MRIEYFRDTDTLYVELSARGIAESGDPDGNAVIDHDVTGRVCALTVEHASDRTDIRPLLVEGIVGRQSSTRDKT
ncbi:MAG: DUF2283 domain-containing protein [Salinisphaeraceae bacterium]